MKKDDIDIIVDGSDEDSNQKSENDTLSENDVLVPLDGLFKNENSKDEASTSFNPADNNSNDNNEKTIFQQIFPDDIEHQETVRLNDFIDLSKDKYKEILTKAIVEDRLEEAYLSEYMRLEAKKNSSFPDKSVYKEEELLKAAYSDVYNTPICRSALKNRYSEMMSSAAAEGKLEYLYVAETNRLENDKKFLPDSVFALKRDILSKEYSKHKTQKGNSGKVIFALAIAIVLSVSAFAYVNAKKNKINKNESVSADSIKKTDLIGDNVQAEENKNDNNATLGKIADNTSASRENQTENVENSPKNIIDETKTIIAAEVAENKTEEKTEDTANILAEKASDSDVIQQKTVIMASVPKTKKKRGSLFKSSEKTPEEDFSVDLDISENIPADSIKTEDPLAEIESAYKNASKKNTKTEEETKKPLKVPRWNKGDKLPFGNAPYYADGGRQPLIWIVLEKYDDGTALLITKNVIDSYYYYININSPFSYSTTWETSSIRTWLNKTFLESAFTPKEREGIIISSIENKKNKYYGTKGGNNTQDKVFLLSIDEAGKYFKKNSDREAEFTPYAARYIKDETILDSWWLRSPGFNSESAAFVKKGVISHNGKENSSGIGVRPVIRADLSFIANL